MAKAKRKNNGYFFEFEDGYYGWTAGWNGWEKRLEISKHGRLIKWERA